MNMKKKLLLLALFFSIGSNSIVYGKIFLLSYEGSGSHWFMYSTQYLFHKVWHAPTRDLCFFQNLSLEKDVCFRGHQVCGDCLTKRKGEKFIFDKEKDVLILLLRDFKELSLRTSSPRPFSIDEYFSHLEFFDEWDTERKLLIYYQDLMNNPIAVLQKCEQFFGPMKGSIEDFFKNIEKHKKDSSKYLKKLHKFPLPSSSNQGYYLNKMSEEEKKFMNQKIHSLNPYLYDKYLRVYQ